MIHSEVVLQGDGRKGLSGGLHLHVLLGFYGLMESVAPTAAFHDTTRLFVNNLHFTVNHYVFIVAVEHGVSLEQLQNGVHTLALDGILLQEGVLLLQALLFGKALVALEEGKLGSNIRQDEEGGIAHLLGQPFVSLVGEVNTLEFLVYYEVKRRGGLRHALVVVLHINLLSVEQAGLDARFGEIFDESLVLGQGFVTAEELQKTLLLLLLVVRLNELLGF